MGSKSIHIGAETAVRQYLERRQIDNVRPQDVLMELARWYGLLVPNGTKWRFVHRAIHDYLAAKYMLENGMFNQDAARRNWRRASYAACQVDDATSYIRQSLKGDRAEGGDLDMFVECCANGGSFVPIIVARDLMTFYETSGQKMCEFNHDSHTNVVSIALEQDYLGFVRSEMLHAMVEIGSMDPRLHRGSAIIVGLALSELRRRTEQARVTKHWESWMQGITWQIKRHGAEGEVSFATEDFSGRC